MKTGKKSHKIINESKFSEKYSFVENIFRIFFIEIFLGVFVNLQSVQKRTAE